MYEAWAGEGGMLRLGFLGVVWIMEGYAVAWRLYYGLLDFPGWEGMGSGAARY